MEKHACYKWLTVLIIFTTDCSLWKDMIFVFPSLLINISIVGSLNYMSTNSSSVYLISAPLLSFFYLFFFREIFIHGNGTSCFSRTFRILKFYINSQATGKAFCICSVSLQFFLHLSFCERFLLPLLILCGSSRPCCLCHLPLCICAYVYLSMVPPTLLIPIYLKERGGRTNSGHLHCIIAFQQLHCWNSLHLLQKCGLSFHGCT